MVGQLMHFSDSFGRRGAFLDASLFQKQVSQPLAIGPAAMTPVPFLELEWTQS